MTHVDRSMSRIRIGRTCGAASWTALSFAVSIASLLGCQHRQTQLDPAGFCPPLPTDLAIVRAKTKGATLIAAQFKRFDSVVIPSARMFLRHLSSSDTSFRQLIADSAGESAAMEIAPGRYFILAGAAGFGPLRDTIEVYNGELLRLTVSLAPESNDRCGPDVIIVPRPPR